jgi:dihydropteroate synthase
MSKNIDKITSFSQKKVFEYNGKMMDFSVPHVMGIVNVTPDSFYEDRTGGREDFKTVGLYVEKVEGMILAGAYIIDIGAVSTRPGAAEVSEEEEKRRLLPVLKEFRNLFPEVIISIDTYRSEIARWAADEGADMINDISGGTFDLQMLSVIADLQIPYIIMHIQGTPATMQLNPAYDDVVDEVSGFLLGQAKMLEEKGHHKIILDPGFGFGKTVEHNYTLLSHLDEFVKTGYPILAGLSRKSMINKVLNIKPVEALNATTVLNTLALIKGTDILRVHDVEEAVQAVKLVGNFFKQ